MVTNFQLTFRTLSAFCLTIHCIVYTNADKIKRHRYNGRNILRAREVLSLGKFVPQWNSIYSFGRVSLYESHPTVTDRPDRLGQSDSFERYEL